MLCYITYSKARAQTYMSPLAVFCLWKETQRYRGLLQVVCAFLQMSVMVWQGGTAGKPQAFYTKAFDSTRAGVS